ncbi:mitochondrial proton/calcium exchanger protein-like protein isoform X1 [Tanacetum coccineum]
MKETLSKFMSESAKRHKENSNLIKEIRASTDAAIQNQGAWIKTLEIQIRKIRKVLQERGSGSLPSSIEANLRDHVMSISTTVEADTNLIRRMGSFQYAKGSYRPKFLEANSYEVSHINNSIPQKEKDSGSFTLPCYINNVCFNNALADLGASESAKICFPVDFIILDMPEDVKVPLILGRPFLSTAHAKIDVFKRNITLTVGDEKIIFKSMKPARSLIKRVYMLGLRERMELDLEARLIGETLVLNRSLHPLYGDYIKLNDLNIPLELRRDHVDDLMPTIEEGEWKIWMATEFKTWEISFLENHSAKLSVWKQKGPHYKEIDNVGEVSTIWNSCSLNLHGESTKQKIRGVSHSNSLNSRF